MDEAVDAAEVDEGAELREPDDHAFADLADGQRAEQLLFLLVELFLQHLALREHHPMALVVEVDHLQAQALADEFVEVAHRLAPDLRCGTKPRMPRSTRTPPLTTCVTVGLDHFVVIVSGDDLFPGLERSSPALGEEQRAVLVVDPVDHDLELVVDLEVLSARSPATVRGRGRIPLRLSADVDEELVLILGDDDAR